jgi:hypothetical protein
MDLEYKSELGLLLSCEEVAKVLGDQVLEMDSPLGLGAGSLLVRSAHVPEPGDSRPADCSLAVWERLSETGLCVNRYGHRNLRLTIYLGRMLADVTSGEFVILRQEMLGEEQVYDRDVDKLIVRIGAIAQDEGT